MADCSFPKGVRLEFPNDNILVKAYDADVRKKRRNFAVGQFEVSEEAGELIGGNTPEAALAYLQLGGERVERMYFAEDNLKFERKLDKTDIGVVDLLDGRKVLERGSIEKVFDKVELGEVIKYIVERRNDPEGIIQDYEFTGVNPTSTQGREGVATSLFKALEGFPVIENQLISRVVEYDFDGVPPIKALDKITNDFGIDWWLELDGTLKFGFDPAQSNIVGTAAGNDALVLSRYSVTEKQNKVNSVHVRQERAVDDGSFFDTKTLGLIAEAKVEGKTGSTEYFDVSGNARTPEAIESVAKRLLVQEIMDNSYGSMEINGLASTETSTAANLDVGDIIAVDTNVNSWCNKQVITGLFLITGVHHRISGGMGWEINLDVARIPDFNSVTTTSVWYDPRTNKQYESLEQYSQEKRNVDTS